MSQQTLYQLNLQRHFGGGEVYTRFLCAALHQLGWHTTLLVHADAGFWHDLDLPGVTLRPIRGLEEVPAALPVSGALLLTHGSVGSAMAARLAADHRLYGMAHMPLLGRDGFQHYHRVFAVSAYVLRTLREAGVTVAHAEPWYGVADVARLNRTAAGPIRQASPYDWDERKFRDRLLGWCYPWLEPLRQRPLFQRLPGLTLGIVSRITPIKQFPLLFQLLAPVLSQHPGVRLEIFGSGGYASLRDLRASLRGVAAQTRWWGQQQDVAAVYRQLDFVLTGLPEREALGLNVIEAQACGTPVLAVRAEPFSETVVDGVSGYLYQDPRIDHGADFARVLDIILTEAQHPQPLTAVEHLHQFGLAAFSQRVARGLAD